MKYVFELRETLRKMKTGLIIATVLYVTSFILGWYIVNAQGIFALEVRLGFTNAFTWLHQPFNTISKVVIQSIFPWTRQPPRNISPSQIPSLSSVQAMEYFILLTLVLFAIGLLYTFAATTLLGVVPLVGTILVGFVAVVEGVGLGGRASSALDYLGFPPFAPEAFLASIVPVLLTLIAEISSSSAGFHIAFVLLRAKHGSRWSSFKGAWRDASRIYALVIIPLAMAWIVELIGYIYLSATIFVNASVPLSILHLFINDTDERTTTTFNTMTNYALPFKATPNNPAMPIVDGKTYVITLVATFQDNSTCTVSATVVTYSGSWITTTNT